MPGTDEARSHVRPISENERAYVELGRRLALPVIQLVLGCDGGLTLAELAPAVAAAAEACPDARARQRGWTWVDSGLAPPVREGPGEGFEGRTRLLPGDMGGLLGRPMRPDRDPLAEVVLVREAPDRFALVFRIFHGVMDGQAGLAFLANVFRHLRGEPLVAQRSTETDRAFLLRHGAARRPVAVRPDCRPGFPGGLARREDLYWLRRTVPGQWLGTTSRVACALATLYPRGPVRVLLPASIRRLEPQAPPCGNMTLPLYLTVSAEDGWYAVYRRLFAELQAGADLNLAATEVGLPRWLPSWVVQAALEAVVRWQARSNAFFSAATLTNLGRVDLAALSAPQARARTLCSLPTHQPLVPLSLAITEHAAHAEIVLSAYAGVVPPNLGGQVLDAVEAALA